jgi:hypothetical protein
VEQSEDAIIEREGWEAAPLEDGEGREGRERADRWDHGKLSEGDNSEFYWFKIFSGPQTSLTMALCKSIFSGSFFFTISMTL